MDKLFSELEQKHNLPEGLLSAVQSVESSGDKNAVSPKGARGTFQFMPKTAKEYGVDVTDPVSSATGAAKYLSDLVNQYGSVKAALAHYNGGTISGKTVAIGKEAPFQETRNYLMKVNEKLPSIDASQVQWDSGEKIDPSQVQWDGASTQQKTAQVDPAQVDWDKKQFEAQSVLTNKPSNTELFMQGAKKSVTDLGYGAKQLLDIPAQYLEEKFGGSKVGELAKQLGMPTAKESAEETNRAVLEDRLRNQEMMNTPAGMAGYVTGSIGTGLAGGLGLKAAGTATNLARPVAIGEALINPATYKAAATVGGVQGALQPTIEGESKLFNTGSGLALGAAGLSAVNALGRIAQPTTQNLSQIGKEAVEYLRKAGIPMDAAQTTGSALLSRVKAALNDNPLTAGAESVFTGKQKEAYTKAVAKTMGSDANAITPDVINKAKSRIGQVYDDVVENVSINPALHDKSQNVNSLYYNLNDIKNEARKVLTDEGQFKSLTANIDDIVSAAQKNNGQISGSQYKNIKSILDKISMGTDPSKADLRVYAREVRDSLNEALTLSADKAGRSDLVEKLKVANKQWGNMRKIEDVALKSEVGDVSPSLLYNSLTSKSKRHAFYADDPELAKLAQAGKIILPSKTPNSGTVARLAAQAAPAALGSGAYGLYEGDIAGAAKGAALGYALPKAAQVAINNPALARYLEQGVQNVPVRSMLQLPQNVGAQKIVPGTFNAYLQGRSPAKQ
jgi:hypothetical protein